jgi:hypothetical protein
MMSLGLGAVDQRTLLGSSSNAGLIVNSLIANAPQTGLSIIYYTYNSLFTCFMLSREWDQLSRRRSGLRVSNPPKGAQKTTYFLQLPYRIAFPLMIFSGVMHWMCAQSLFLVSIRAGDESIITCGYSPVAVLILTLMLLSMLLIAFTVGNRKVRGLIPFAGTCSASMSAMCHPYVKDDRDRMPFLPVKWGVIGDGNVTEDGEWVGHCSISHEEVTMPEVGRLYAGSKLKQH